MSDTTVTAAAPASAKPLSRQACVQYLQTHGAYSGHSRDGVDVLREVVAEHMAATAEQVRPDPEAFTSGVLAVLDGADPEATADALVAEPNTAGGYANANEADRADGWPERAAAVADAVAAADCAECPDPEGEVRNPECDGLQASADPVERAALAQAEWKALKAWRGADVLDGRGPRPCTPNLDALNAEHAAAQQGAHARPATGGKQRTKAASAGQQAPKPRTAAAFPRYTDAMAAKKAKQRTPVKVTDEQLAAHIAGVLAAHPDADPDTLRNPALEVAYWLEGFSLSRQRWNAAWAAATA